MYCPRCTQLPLDYVTQQRAACIVDMRCCRFCIDESNRIMGVIPGLYHPPAPTPPTTSWATTAQPLPPQARPKPPPPPVPMPSRDPPVPAETTAETTDNQNAPKVTKDAETTAPGDSINEVWPVLNQRRLFQAGTHRVGDQLIKPAPYPWTAAETTAETTAEKTAETTAETTARK